MRNAKIGERVVVTDGRLKDRIGVITTIGYYNRINFDDGSYGWVHEQYLHRVKQEADRGDKATKPGPR
jgi:ribosomal protein S16